MAWNLSIFPRVQSPVMPQSWSMSNLVYRWINHIAEIVSIRVEEEKWRGRGKGHWQLFVSISPNIFIGGRGIHILLVCSLCSNHFKCLQNTCCAKTSYYHLWASRMMFEVWLMPWSPLPSRYAIMCSVCLSWEEPYHQLLNVWILWLNRNKIVGWDCFKTRRNYFPFDS
jgi:hypothetical protein